ncbi:ubiquitin thiolesterase [Exophiala viscosa]|uniref:ubiquitinyl hydrolase 1 n=1 Tax=Exophiala viscosa TaxID=2486360 RepID=A0AAN6DZG4_9EURO|nr:ubiquitin thiolesterase [Exophiala viscosa]
MEADLEPLFGCLQLAGPDMLIDGYDQYNEKENEVVNISPNEGSEEPTDALPRADDYEAMKRHVLIDLPDTEPEAETYNTWHIEKWRTLSRREHGPTFECGGHPWRVLFFPYGNQVDCASFYLEHGFEGDPPADWYACVQFSLVLWNPNDPSLFRTHSATHRFNAKEGDWGFTRFVELRKAFHQPWEEGTRHLIENDEANLTAYIRIIKDPTGVLWHNFEGYDSKKETGMVGLKNQGATCYLNSLIQSLYFTDAFRKAVYQIPTEQEANRSNSAWTLQRLFYRLQKDKFAVSTNELTASFGWDTRQIFEQQDVQELSRILMENLEKKMKGTPAERTLPELFVGKTKTYISCINVDFESSRIEEFWDLQLNVRGNKNLHESFMDYIQVETLEGENKYDAGEPYKLQDARKGVIFESFPPVLHLQLKRFEYDINRDAMMKVNDRHEFPEDFDASLYLSDEAKASTNEPWMYELHGVLVHSGDFNAGHYYAFLKPTKDGHFYKFDDDRVTRATMKEVLEENYGGEYANVANGGPGQRQPYMRGYSTKRSMNAYMLVYIRKSRVDQVLLGVQETDIPSHIERRISEEQTELARKKKEREEAHLYMNVGLITEKTFQSHHSFDLTNYDLESSDPAAPQVHRLLRTTKVSEFAATVAEQEGLGPEQIRFWVMVGRQNKTNRPDQPIREVDISIEEAMNKYGSRGRPFYLWAEGAPRSEDGKVHFPDTTQGAGGNAPILVFLKYFDVKAQTLTGVGHVYVRKLDKVADAAPQINKMMQWDPSTSILLFEEIKFSMIEAMKPKQTFQQSEIQDGDIICFQQNLPDLDSSTVTYTDARQYYDYLLNKIPVTFYPRPGTEGEAFVLNLSKKMTYDQFSGKVGDHLKVDPTHIRFATISATNNKIKMWIKRGLNHNLNQILQSQFSSYGGYATHRPDGLYYEVLETSLADYETKKIMKVIWLSDGISKEEQLEVLVAKNGIIGDLISGIATKLKLDEEVARNIRILEVHGGKIHKELIEDFNVVGVNEFTTLYAERIPDEELNASDDDRFIYCYHFDKEANKPHGVPFKFMLKPGETLKETKERISKRTGIKGKLLQQIKFALVSRALYAKPKYLEDDDVIVDLIQDGDEMLGLDHVNKARNFWGRAEGMFIR